MLNISDFIQVLMLIASTAAIIVSAVMSRQAIKASMDMVREQNHIQMFAEYTKRYQDVIIALPQYDTVEEFTTAYTDTTEEEFKTAVLTYKVQEFVAKGAKVVEGSATTPAEETTENDTTTPAAE